MTGDTTLDRATLNRTTLARQRLLTRHDQSAADMIDHLVGMQGQEPWEPYVGLWSRLSDFVPTELVSLIETRAAVRTLMMRRTLHLLGRTDALEFRPLFQAMLVQRTVTTRSRELGSDFDLEAITAAAEPHFAEEPRLSSEVARLITEQCPEVPIAALADVVGSAVSVVQVPPRGLWGQRAPARNFAMTSWLGDHDPRPAEEVQDELVLRYLRGYGPASSSDVRAWSGLSGLPAVIKRLRPQLRSYRDEAGRELLDLHDAALTDSEVEAPPRFLPCFDNVVLGYADRIRMIDPEHQHLSVASARFVLVDGRVSGIWASIGDADTGVTVAVELFRTLRAAERDALVAEGQALATFLGDGAPGRVILT